MTALATRLFGARVRASHDATALTESSPERLRLARTTGRTVLADYDDAPRTIEESDVGTVVLGEKHALLLTVDGDVIVKQLDEAAKKKPAAGGSRKPLPSQNDSWGFYGTVKGQLGGVDAIFQRMSEVLLAAFPQHTPETVRSFLDSKWGRYLGEELPQKAGLSGQKGYSQSDWLRACDVVSKVAWVGKELDKYAKLPPEDVTEASARPIAVKVDFKSQGTSGDWGGQGHGDSGADFQALAKKHGTTKVGSYGDEYGFLMYAEFSTRDKAAAFQKAVEKKPYVSGARIQESSAALREDSDDLFTAFVGFTDLFKFTSDRRPVSTQFARLKAAVERAYDREGRDALFAALGTALKRDPEVTKLMDDLKLKFSKTVDRLIHDNQESEPMTTRTQLQEEDYAEIVVGDDGLLLLVNGEIVATEDCDLNDEKDCQRAEDALAQQASALGYGDEVDEGTFDASNEKGGTVVNGDEFDDWSKGESYYARRYRRQTSDAETGKPTKPAIECVVDDGDAEERLVQETADFLAGVVDFQKDAAKVREFDRLVAEGDYEGALDHAETLAGSKLDEYKRRVGASLSRFRRSLRTQTSAEKVRNRQRRKEYRTNSTMRRKAARYRVRVKRFRRAYESAPTGRRGVRENAANDTFRKSNDGQASANDTFAQVCAGVFGDLKGEYTSFAGLKERVAKATGEAVSDPVLMRVVSEFVNKGLVRYAAGKGYALAEVDDEAAVKLAKAARASGNRFVVTLATGSPVFLPTREDMMELWKTLPPKMRGTKTTVSGYMQSLGMAEEGGDEGDGE